MSPSAKHDFVTGMRNAVPVAVAAAPFGLLFGALAVDSGMTVFEATFMSATIYAGASQMVGIELFDGTVAPWLVVLSIFAVNFRHVLYSAAVGRHMGRFGFWQKTISFFFLIDPLYAESERHVEQGKAVTFAWFMGMAIPIYACWVAETFLGAIFGGLLEDPERYGIDFLLPLYFLGLVLGFRRRQNWAPVVITSAVGAVAAYHFIGSPWHVSIGAAFGIVAAAVLADPQKRGRVLPEEGEGV